MWLSATAARRQSRHAGCTSTKLPRRRSSRVVGCANQSVPSWWALADAAGNEADVATMTGRR
jgi:hypothetical protein